MLPESVVVTVEIIRNYHFLNKSWRQHPTKQQPWGHQPPITKTIKIWRIRHAGQCWRSRDELISDVHLWTPSHGRAKAGRPAQTYIQQLCDNTGCIPEDLTEAMDDREVWKKRVRNICADSATWWWWWWWWWWIIFFWVHMKIFSFLLWKYIANGGKYVKNSFLLLKTCSIQRTYCASWIYRNFRGNKWEILLSERSLFISGKHWY